MVQTEPAESKVNTTLVLIRIFCTGLDKQKGYNVLQKQEFSLVYGQSANNFYIMLSTHGHGLKQLALGGYSSGFAHIILSVVETVKLVFYEHQGISSYISENISLNMLHLNEE